MPVLAVRSRLYAKQGLAPSEVSAAMNLNLLLILAAILIGVRLPSVMSRLGIPRADKIAFIAMIFSLLGLAWLAGYALGRFI